MREKYKLRLKIAMEARIIIRDIHGSVKSYITFLNFLMK